MFWKKKEEQAETAGKDDVQRASPDKSAGKPAGDTAKKAPSQADELALLYEATIKDIKEGQIVRGKIIEIRPKDAVVDIGYKSEGIVPISEFPDPSRLKIGDEIEVFLDSKENENGCVVISKQKADKLQGWERIISTCKEGDIIGGRPLRKVKGGLMVDVGMEAFLPASLASLKTYSNLDELLGKELEFKIVKINRPRKNIVLSRKDVLQQRAEESKQKLLSVLEKGRVVNGTVKNITDFGAFIDLGGLDGLLHITDMSWGRISHPSEMLAIGDKIEAVVLDFNKDTNRVSLGLKQKTANPWKEVDVKYPAGSKVKGRVVNIMPYGAFVEVEKGIEGLVHISEFSWTKKYSHPNELLAIGDVIETVVLDIDKENRKISLGIKQLEADPWIDVEERFPVGLRAKGKIRNLTDYGAFVELEDGVDGLIHISEMSWTKKISHPKEVLKKGQKIEAVVLSVDAKDRKLSLGMKQLIPDPWDKITKIYKEGHTAVGKVAKVTNFGIFVELETDLEGLVHVSELDEKAQGEIEAKYKLGENIAVKVIKLDDAQRKIALSLDK